LSERAPDAHHAPGRPAGTETDPWAEDERLWGRTYAIPFDRVWKAAKALADGGLRGWTLTRDDDREGVIEADSLTWPGKKRDEVTITVRLDENAQTRVDVSCRRTEGAPARRRHPRIIGRFLKRLDQAVKATSAQKLDPTSRPAWLGSDPS
jgi:hypothetical protein